MPKGFWFDASHIHDLDKKVTENSAIGFRCFESTLHDGTPKFTYTLKSGLSDQRYGQYILQSEGLLKLLNSNNDL